MYEMLINIILIHISIKFFFNIYIFLITKTDFFVTTLNLCIFENLYILYILNTSYRFNYILQCAEKILYFS